MKRIIIFIIVLLLPGLIGAADKKSKDEFLLAKHKVGPIKLGMNIDDLLNQYGLKAVKLVDLQSEGTFTPALEIYLPGAKKGHLSLIVGVKWDKDWVVDSVVVNDSRFKTDKGLGVGSTLGELRKYYKIDNVGGGEGLIIAPVQSLSMAFELYQSHIPPEWSRTADDDLLPNNIKIISVNVYKIP